VAVLRHERRFGRPTSELADRAEQIVETTAIAIEPEPDEAFAELLAHVRREIASIRHDLDDG
jgi:hypothetical protein